MALRFLKLKVNIMIMIKKKMISIDAKAMNTLYCALNKNEFNRIISYKNAKDILKVPHKGTNQVKESKIDMLVHQC